MRNNNVAGSPSLADDITDEQVVNLREMLALMVRDESRAGLRAGRAISSVDGTQPVIVDDVP